MGIITMIILSLLGAMAGVLLAWFCGVCSIVWLVIAGQGGALAAIILVYVPARLLAEHYKYFPLER